MDDSLETVPKMDRELKAKWLTALRSDQYSQTHGTLRDSKGFCCLGVLADTMDSSLWRESDLHTWSYGDMRGYEFLNVILSIAMVDALWQMNDGVIQSEKQGFPQIADWIEQHL